MLFVVYLAIGGRESQSEPAVRVFARAYMHMLLCMSDVDSSKRYQFSNQILIYGLEALSRHWKKTGIYIVSKVMLIQFID